MTAPYLLSVPTFRDTRGALGVLETPIVPFLVKRVYFIYEAAEQTRGGHAHRELQQLILAPAGAVSLRIDDGGGREFHFQLRTPTEAVHVPAGYWRELKMSQDAVCLVLASEVFAETDYIRDYEEFKTWKLSLS